MNTFILQPKRSLPGPWSSRSMLSSERSTATSHPFSIFETPNDSPANVSFEIYEESMPSVRGFRLLNEPATARSEIDEMMLMPSSSCQRSTRAATLSESSARSIGLVPFFEREAPPCFPYLPQSTSCNDSFVPCMTPKNNGVQGLSSPPLLHHLHAEGDGNCVFLDVTNPSGQLLLPDDF